jgi:hypothetical protein
MAVQSESVQQVALAMQVAPHSLCPLGQAQVPPGPEHTRPPLQFELVQQLLLEMQAPVPGQK